MCYNSIHYYLKNVVVLNGKAMGNEYELSVILSELLLAVLIIILCI